MPSPEMNRVYAASAAQVLELIAQYPLAWVASATRGVRGCALPMLAETGESGELAALFGHMSRANPLITAFRDDPRATLVFRGPDGYISPRIISRQGWAPTWNYASVEVEARVELVPEETDAALVQLAAHLEGGHEPAWTVERVGARYEQLKARIIAFRAHVERVLPTFKLGQDEDEASFADIVEHHPDQALVAWMRRVNARSG